MDADLQRIREFYESGAERHNKLTEKYWPIKRTKIKWQLEGRKKVLVPGYGTGLDHAYIPEEKTVIGIDISPAMLSKASKNYYAERAALIQADAENIPLADDSCDAAVMSFFLCVTPNPIKALEEVVRVTETGSPLIIFDHFRKKPGALRKATGYLNYRFGAHYNPNRDIEKITARLPAELEVHESEGMMGRTIKRPVHFYVYRNVK